MSRLAAVINCASSFIRLVIAEFEPDGSPRIVESAIQYLGLGRDVFTTGLVRKRTALQAIQVFQKYKDLISAYGLKPSDVKVIGTAAIREARNRDTVIDRIEVRTGFRIQVIDGMEETRLTYMSIQYAFRDQWAQLARGNAMIVDVGGGSTEVILLRRGLITAIHSISFGAIRMEETYRGLTGPLAAGEDTVRQTLRTIKDMLEGEMKAATVRAFVASGTYARLAAQICGAVEHDRHFVIARPAWDNLAKEAETRSLEDCVRTWNLPMSAAEGLGHALMACSYLMEDSPVEEVWIPKSGHSEGLIMELGPGIDPAIQERFYAQVRSSALNLGRRYHFDAEHARHVAELSLSLFDQLQPEHGLGVRARLLLEIGALLHDIGTFVRPSGHHKHSQYLIDNSEIFGLDPQELRIVSHLARYHRKSPPSALHPTYMALSREDRLIVLKLVAILRVADALDRGHSQKITRLRVERRADEIVLWSEYTVDIAGERLSLSQKGQMFEEVFGLKVSLV